MHVRMPPVGGRRIGYGCCLHTGPLHTESPGRPPAEVCERAFAVAADKGFRTAMLVAVSGAGSYWAKLGFEDMTTEGLRAKLKDYGDDALYMERSLSCD